MSIEPVEKLREQIRDYGKQVAEDYAATAKEMSALRSERDNLRQLIERHVVVRCDQLAHKKGDHHDDWQPCPVEALFNQAMGWDKP